MTKRDAARKVLIFVIWCLTGFPFFVYLIEYGDDWGIEAWHFGVLVAVAILLVNVVGHYLSEWLIPASEDYDLIGRQNPVFGDAAWRIWLRVGIWIVGLGSVAVIGMSGLGILKLDDFVDLFRAVARLL